ncbi:SRPBCC family protein [Saccharopolyspora gregorii]|uniref:SRPBCC family protein n=1 Tax=Saccharopolyspora gregorii TaxID=33914 RepID=UPI0021AD24BF|nr:SRPBCC family protein [Saccharopolyspora gregorii]
MAEQRDDSGGGAARGLPWDHLRDAVRDLLSALAERAVSGLGERAEGLVGRLTDYARDDEGGGSGLLAAVTGGGSSGAAGEDSAGGGGSGGGGGGGSSAKVVNIVEQCDVGLPLRVAYDQWTRFEDFPSFTRKVESVQQESDEELDWRAQIFLSHRSWRSTIQEQVPDSRIVWHSTGSKGSVDGTVTFHELGPTLTRILLVLEYHPQGFFEKTANLWRAQGRRARSDFKHVQRHLMTRTVLEQDEVEGWRGEIRDGEVVRSHEDALAQEQGESAEDDGSAGDDGGSARREDGDDEELADEIGQDRSGEASAEPEPVRRPRGVRPVRRR